MKDNIAAKLTSFMGKFSEITSVKAMTQGMMATMPLTLGTFVIAILSSLPIDSWQGWLSSSGVLADMQAVAGGTTEILAIFLVLSISYKYASLRGKNSLSAAVMSLGFYFVLVPQKIEVATDNILNAFQKDYLGSSGVFVAIIVALVISKLYCGLTEKGLILKLPDSVPHYVSESFSTVFVAIIIFTSAFVVRMLFGFTSYGNIFDCIQALITAPIMGIGSSTVAIIGLSCIANLVWFFGIHPATVQTVSMPIYAVSIAGNIEAFQTGNPLPYITFAVLTFGFLTIGGQGGTLGLAINLALFSKSERYKTLGKLAIVPTIFNINEPLIFGLPIILNVIYFIPMVLSSVVAGIIGVIGIKLGAFASMNPLIMLPNVIPVPISIFVSTGLVAALTVVVAIAALTLLYYPFFRIGDKRALAEEKVAESEAKINE
ncbi:PTS sugar transporter subunit IIC [Enterococcus casseliflavus]|uniref:PTS sugar transporter subunit IIC n=1 Tax=Enterococcus casseliflavus TaxID=37734 RepID=UPI003D0A2F47